MQFTDFDFDDELLDGIGAMGYEQATPVQQAVIPAVLEGRDVIAAAQTGTGKTAAFLLPIIQRLLSEPHSANEINALVIVPTRELAIQIAQTLEGIAYFTPVSFIAVYGGNDGALFANEKKALTSGADIVISTPGRLIAHQKMGYLKFNGLKYLVLDEADRMLDMGFYEDIMKIIHALPQTRQNLFFSATMPAQMRKLANSILAEPVEVNIAISKPPEQIQQGVYLVFEHQKQPLIRHILAQKEFESVIVFCSSKQSVKSLTSDLNRSGLSVKQIHSDLEQTEREQALLDFRNRKIRILIATDIISRGIDIEDIDLVINYDVPHDGEDYVHRIGRTARAASKGTAYTLLAEGEQRKFAQIEKLLGKQVERLTVPETLGAVPQPVTSFSNNKKKKKTFRRTH